MKATRPVSVAGIEFDALIDESHTLESTVPEYPVEDGYSVSDSIILNPETLSMTLYLTDTPVTWYRKHGAVRGRAEAICAQLKDLYYQGQPVVIVTSDATYTNMAISSISFNKSADVGYAREIPISFKRIRTTFSRTTTMPDLPVSYGKSGTTQASAGNANTQKVSGNSSSSDAIGSSIAYNVVGLNSTTTSTKASTLTQRRVGRNG